jgi:hypothetical protein
MWGFGRGARDWSAQRLAFANRRVCEILSGTRFGDSYAARKALVDPPVPAWCRQESLRFLS